MLVLGMVIYQTTYPNLNRYIEPQWSMSINTLMNLFTFRSTAPFLCLNKLRVQTQNVFTCAMRHFFINQNCDDQKFNLIH